MSIFKSIFHSRDKPSQKLSATGSLNGSRYSFFFGGTSSAKPVNEQTAMQMTAVYYCVRILSETVAGLPLHVYQYNDTGGKEKPLNHPLYRLLHDEPNPHINEKLYRAQAGAYSVKENADAMLAKIKSAGFSDAYIKYE